MQDVRLPEGQSREREQGRDDRSPVRRLLSLEGGKRSAQVVVRNRKVAAVRGDQSETQEIGP